MLDANPVSTVSHYSDIFELRGRLYHQAMQEFPDARAQEFLNVIAEASLTEQDIVVDVPSGGAYISRYLSEVELLGLEVTPTFARLAREKDQTVILYDNDRFPLKTASIDRVLSIAGLHHVPDKRAVFSEMHRVLSPEGRLVVADVAEDSYVRRFLDDFVGMYSDTGHFGWYFGDTTRSELKESGLKLIGDKPLDYCWYAQDIAQLARFCKLLFGMVRADTDTVADGIREYLGTQEFGDKIGLNWQLHCFTCEPQSDSGSFR